MSSCDNCKKTGFGVYAGNSACGSSDTAKKAKTMGGNYSGYIDGIPYATTKINVENMIPILGIAQTGLAALQASKTSQAEAGKVFTQPQTTVGKVLGRLTGRTQAAEISTAQSQAPLAPMVSKNLQSQGIPISGSLMLGTEQNQTLKILGVIGAVIAFIFYTNKPRGRKRR